MATFLVLRTFWKQPPCEKRASNKETPPVQRGFIYQLEGPWLLPREHLGINQALRQEGKLSWTVDLSIATISVLTVLFEKPKTFKGPNWILGTQKINFSNFLVLWQIQKKQHYFSIHKIDKHNGNNFYFGDLYVIEKVEM